jgi:hypothetical protein
MTKKEEILKLLLQGKTIEQIAKAVKVKSQYVYYIRWMDQKAKKSSKIIEAAQEMKTTLDALDKIKDKPDPVNHPPHYKAGGIETIDFIEAKDLNYRLGNVVKYVSRAGKKDSDPIQDLEKAAWYLQREIDARKRA